MKNLFMCALVVAGLSLTACASANVKTTTNTFTPDADSKTILVKPDVELSVLMASGMTEPRAEWSEQATQNLTADLSAALKDRASTVTVMDPSVNLDSQQIQMLKLTDAVMQAAQLHDFGPVKLPNKEDVFDRTIGPGARVLAGSSDADYALMTTARGSYQSAGKAVMNLATAALIGYAQFGGQTAFLSLVDLDSGDIVWSNIAIAGPNDDMREPDGAERLAVTLLKDFPLE